MVVIVLLIILSFLNQGYSQERPILIDTAEVIIMQNSWIKVEISKAKGEISSFVHRHSDSAMNLLTKPANIIFRDKRNNKEYQQSDGKVVKIATESYSDSVRTIFNINFYKKLHEILYSIQIRFTLDIQALRWDALLKTGLSPDWEANIDFSIPVIANMEYAFWTKDGAPFKLPITRTVVYRRRGGVIPGGLVIPTVILFDTTSNIGLSFVSPFELRKPGLQFQLNEDSFNISNYYLRLSKNHPAHAAVYIVPHEGCWRPGFAWLYDKYTEYFNSVSESVLNGEGWFTILDERTAPFTIADFKKRGVAWVEFFHFPFFGLYAPDKDSWMVIVDTNGISYEDWKKNFSPKVRTTGFRKNNNQIALLRNNYDFQTYLYFQSFESWKQYAKKYYPNDITVGSNGETLPAWMYCYLMNPDPNHPWGKHINSQIKILLDKYPNVDGIFYDRDDYCDYDYAHNDGVTMIGGDSVYMLGFAQEKINDSVLNAVHSRGKGIWTNGPTSVEVCKGMDGIMSENLAQAPNLQYLGINRPLILLPYDTIPKQTEEKLKTALYTGHFPSIAWHRANPKCIDIDTRYQPLFSLYKSKKWVLYPNALQLPAGIKGNIFQIPDSDYLVAMIDPEKYITKSDPFQYDIWAKVRVPDMHEVKYCYFLSGDYQGVSQDTIYNNQLQADMGIRIPAHRASSLIQLSKRPRYEITRISSPVLTRGESEKLEFRIQNIGYHRKMRYDIKLIAPFATRVDSFSLEPKQSHKIELDFKVPKDFVLGETTIKVIINNPRNDTVIFTTWVVELVQFQSPEKIFIHSAKGETIRFTLVNNTERILKVRLTGSFVEGKGEVKLPKQSVVLKPLEAKELKVNIISDSELGKIRLLAQAENRTIEVIRPVERAMKPELSDYFNDDFSSDNMDKWDAIFGIWMVENEVAKGSGLWHLALKNGNWTNFKFQVNTKIEGSNNLSVDWLKSQIFFRVQDEGNFYRFGIQGDDITLYKRVEYRWYFLAICQFNAKKNVWYNLIVEVKNDSIKGFLDGNQVISVKDTTFRTGGIGIGVLEDDMVNYYDDVVVRPIGQ